MKVQAICEDGQVHMIYHQATRSGGYWYTFVEGHRVTGRLEGKEFYAWLYDSNAPLLVTKEQARTRALEEYVSLQGNEWWSEED